MWLFLGLGLQTEATEAARSKILGDIFFSGITLKCRAVSLSSPGPAYLPSVYILWWCLCLNLLLIFFLLSLFFSLDLRVLYIFWIYILCHVRVLQGIISQAMIYLLILLIVFMKSRSSWFCCCWCFRTCHLLEDTICRADNPPDRNKSITSDSPKRANGVRASL